MRWTIDELNAYHHRRAAQAGGQVSGTEPQCPVQHEPMAQAIGEETNAGRISISITSFRVRPVDPDNLCGKYFTDCLRYAGIIQDDSAEHITYKIEQRKVSAKTDEHTLIEVERLPE